MLKAGFILLTLVLAVILFVYASAIADKAYTRVREQRKFKIRTALVLIFWFAYVTFLSLKGVFLKVTLPPRIPLLLVLPAFLFFLFFFTNSKTRKIIDATPSAWPVYFQSFRIFVELLLFGMSVQGMLPKAATFEGYNYDIAIGLTAPLVAFFMLVKRKEKKAIVLLWNFAGLATLLIVVVVLLTHAYFPSMWGLSESILPKGLGIFPFTFLAGFLMPIAVFMHVFSIIKTRRPIRY